jgi:hypothetical protein
METQKSICRDCELSALLSEKEIFRLIQEKDRRLAYETKPITSTLIDEFNEFLSDIHTHSPENGYRWKAYIEFQLQELLSAAKSEYWGEVN